MSPRESATVILLRDGAAGPEVFMVRRHLKSDFVGGAYVFPGGVRDAEDPSLAACAVRETLEEVGVSLVADALHDYAHWVTPEGQPRRYSTRFYVAVMPEGQEPQADDLEVEAGVWVTPEAALAAHGRGEMTMIFPTLRTLEELSGFASVEALIASLPDRDLTPRLPRPAMREGRAVLLLPGEPGYEEAALQPPPAFDPTQR